jgi:hypothetical protein
MNPRFATAISSLHSKLQTLLACPALSPAKLPRDFGGAGIYLFTEAQRHLYVGRSNDLRFRVQTHLRPSAQTNQAAFAYRLAREVAGIKKVSYKKLTPEEDWSLVEPFLSAFPASKERISRMELRFVLEPEPLSQMLLEAYVAIALETPYNDFDNH